MNRITFHFFLALIPFLYSGCAAQNKPISVEINANTKKNISNYLFGFNTQLMRGPSWTDNQFLNSVKGLHPQNIRFPGGTNANYWNWKNGWIKTDIPIRKEWQTLPAIPYKLSDLKVAYDATHATPVFVLNLLTSTLPEQLEMLHSAQQLGIPVELIELGNEFYLEDKDNKSVFATAESYAEIANQYITALKRDFPQVKIAVVGNSLRDGQLNNSNLSVRFLKWNEVIYDKVKGADAISFHVYGGSGLDLILTNEKKIKHMQRSDYTDAEKKVYQQAFDDPNSVSKTLGAPYARTNMADKNDIAHVPAGWKVWITEYNLFENEGIVAGTWAHGLYVASQALSLMSNKKIDLICYHNIAHGAQFGAIFNNENGFNGFLKNSPTFSDSYSASGYVLQMIGEAIMGKTEMLNLDFSNSLQTFFFKDIYYPSLLGFKFNKGNQSAFIIVNLSDKKIDLDMKKITGENLSFKQLSGNPRSQVSSQNDLNIKVGKLAPMLEVGPYSITKVE